MSDSETNGAEKNVFSGMGEFQLRDIHVIAKVEVQGGVVQKISFNSGAGEQIAEAGEIAEQLTGKALARALELKARDSNEADDRRGDNTVEVALFEAFHRAVETYLDDE